MSVVSLNDKCRYSLGTFKNDIIYIKRKLPILATFVARLYTLTNKKSDPSDGYTPYMMNIYYVHRIYVSTNNA